MRKPKIYEIEWMRALAFLAVVMQHTIAHYTYVPEVRLEDGVIFALLLLVSKFAVPLFIFISGLLLFYNYDANIRYGTFIRKRFKDIVLPYLPWAVLYAVLFHGLDLTTFPAWQKLGLLVLTGTASYHLWYVVMTMQLYILFPFIQRLSMPLRKVSSKVTWGVMITLGVLYILQMTQNGWIYETAYKLNIPILTDFFTEYLDRNAFMFLFYFVMGAGAGMHLEKWRSWLIKYRWYILSIYAAVVIGMLAKVVSSFKLSPELAINYNDTLLLRPLMAVFLIISVLAMHVISISLSKKSNSTVSKIVLTIGSYSYVAYLAHALMLNMAYAISDSIWPLEAVIARNMTTIVIATVASIAVAYVIRLVVKQIKNLMNAQKDKPMSA
ncbi:acyltransferase [Paenibacillus sp. N1-5-1-14]|uniref:acyltransferase n=1 Tax=Paenibacillus radicibacter TaxID=2972488 RepID=UPI0021597AF4|nr:acyltransferase [Paenibacillus radicibacter]MCR8644826.1 acyltransferase [Paenibacillus radicibacter]